MNQRMWVMDQLYDKFIYNQALIKTPYLKNLPTWACLVHQWWGVCAGDTGSNPGWEDSSCCRATSPTRHNYWACALESESHNFWAHGLQLLKPACLRAHSYKAMCMKFYIRCAHNWEKLEQPKYPSIGKHIFKNGGISTQQNTTQQ